MYHYAASGCDMRTRQRQLIASYAAAERVEFESGILRNFKRAAKILAEE